MVKKQIIELLNLLGFRQDGNVYTKKYDTALHPLQVDVEKERIYYENSGITVNRSTTSNFSEDENLVVLECIDRLLSKGYHANHIELEPHWKLGHGTKGGYADIWVRTYTDNAFDGMMMIRILCLSSNAKQAVLSLTRHGMIHWMMVLSCFLISSKSQLLNSCAFIRLVLLTEKSCQSIN